MFSFRLFTEHYPSLSTIWNSDKWSLKMPAAHKPDRFERGHVSPEGNSQFRKRRRTRAYDNLSDGRSPSKSSLWKIQQLTYWIEYTFFRENGLQDLKSVIIDMSKSNEMVRDDILERLQSLPSSLGYTSPDKPVARLHTPLPVHSSGYNGRFVASSADCSSDTAEMSHWNGNSGLLDPCETQERRTFTVLPPIRQASTNVSMTPIP